MELKPPDQLIDNCLLREPSGLCWTIVVRIAGVAWL